MSVDRVLITIDYPELAQALESAGFAADVATTRDEILNCIPRYEVICVTDFDREMLGAARRLKWIQALLAGVERVMFPELINSDVVVTCLKECFAAPGAEHAMATILAVNYRLDYYIRAQARRTFTWIMPRELRGQIIGIVGFGNIGQTLAQRARAFEMRTWALARRPRPSPAPADRLLAPQQLPELLSSCDFVVVTVPLTAETAGLIGPAQLAGMKPSAWLIDMSGREPIIDRPAVFSALARRQIAGADLQFKNPPPADSPAWQLENLIMSQWSANSREEGQRSVQLIVENLQRYLHGQALRSVVDKAAGY